MYTQGVAKVIGLLHFRLDYYIVGITHAEWIKARKLYYLSTYVQTVN